MGQIFPDGEQERPHEGQKWILLEKKLGGFTHTFRSSLDIPFVCCKLKKMKVSQFLALIRVIHFLELTADKRNFCRCSNVPFEGNCEGKRWSIERKWLESQKLIVFTHFRLWFQ